MPFHFETHSSYSFPNCSKFFAQQIPPQPEAPCEKLMAHYIYVVAIVCENERYRICSTILNNIFILI